jgi:dUTP pyrophosphatase
MKIKVRYHSSIDKIKKLDIGNWIDLRSAENVSMQKGDYRLISLGISLELPPGYEAHIAPRSSTFKNFKIIQANSFGVVDESYCGDMDVWMFPAIALEDTFINFNDRICQFRIMKKQPELEFIEVDYLENPNRNGFGSTGTK